MVAAETAKGEVWRCVVTPDDGSNDGPSAQDEVIIGNSLPVASAGPDRRAVINMVVLLDGSASSDTDGDPLTWLWTQVDGPTGDDLSDITAISPIFTPTQEGAYTFSLVVNDGTDDSLPDTVTVNVKIANVTPVLSAGAVSPGSGYAADSYIYTAAYTDDDNDSPLGVTVSIDGGMPQDMSIRAGGDADYSNGEIYEYSIPGDNLGLGSHTFQFAAGDGMDDATGDVAPHDGPIISSPPATGGGGGGGGGGLLPLEFTNKNGRKVSGAISREGKIWGRLLACSTDGRVTITVPVGTCARDKDGKPLTGLRIFPDENPPPIPEDIALIGLVYSFEPDGASFDPPINLIMHYAPDSLSEGVAEEELYIACWDGNRWLSLGGTVDMEANTVSVTIGHFSRFAILGKLPPPPSPPPLPASFTVSSLTISPDEVDCGDEVLILTEVVNNGGSAGEYTLVCKINGEEETAKEVTLAAGEREEIKFIVAKDVAATYEVEVNGATSLFVVREPVTPLALPAAEVPVNTATASKIEMWHALLILFCLLSVFFLGYLCVRRKYRAPGFPHNP